MKSWKTTVTGIGMILVAVGSALQAQFDSDPATVADWGIVISLLIGAFGLFLAKDEKAGA